MLDVLGPLLQLQLHSHGLVWLVFQLLLVETQFPPNTVGPPRLSLEISLEVSMTPHILHLWHRIAYVLYTCSNSTVCKIPMLLNLTLANYGLWVPRQLNTLKWILRKQLLRRPYTIRTPNALSSIKYSYFSTFDSAKETMLLIWETIF